MKPIQDIYYVKHSDPCCEIIDKYEITRSHIGNPKENEGIKQLVEAVENELNSWRDDIYYEERISMEAIQFLQTLMYHQYRPNNAWGWYYERLLKHFHTHNQLTFKKDLSKRKTYRKKQPCVILTLPCKTRVIYNSYREVCDDFGRYRTDIIINHTRKENGKNIDFEYILGLIL